MQSEDDRTRRDEEIRGHVTDEMTYDPAVAIRDLSVVVEDGCVTLTGAADSYGTRQAAVEAAWRIGGVAGVDNAIVVDPNLPGMPADEEIAADVRARLDKDPLVPRGRIMVSVHDGVVTMMGTVDWHFQRKAARKAAEKTNGVREVKQKIVINRSHASPQEIMAAIRKALDRSAQVEGSRIQVFVDGGHVTLSGTARSFSERQAAEEAAYRARGVTDLTDNIVIQPFQAAG
jgi:osmotically-inducible protein OsmY